MCGIAGLLLFHSAHSRRLELDATRMASALVNRGPDSAGSWSDPTLLLGLAHQRLAVLDISSAGHQPMYSDSSRYVIAFNGEIYNHAYLRRELERTGRAPLWRGNSDTETLLAAFEAWGVEKTLQLCNGMFALAIVDYSERQLHLARDRFGEKPLYYGISGSGQQRALLFGSELAALKAFPAFNNLIDRQALAELLRFGFIPAPLSIYGGITKLSPGHLVSIPLPLTSGSSLPVSRPWWNLHDLILTAHNDVLTSESEALELLEFTLTQSVCDQAIADVPLGCFLSGGIDSSLVASLLQSQLNRPLRTFTVGFEEVGFNEAHEARAVAAQLSTDHSEITLTSADALALIPQLPQLYSEPFADSSQLPTHLVCREARRAGLTVALSGDGGDELFGGYNRYIWGVPLWNRLRHLPGPLRRSLGSTIARIPPSSWDALSGPLPVIQLGHKVHKLADRLKHVDSTDELYRSLLCEWRDPSSLLQGDLWDASVSTSIDKPLPTCLRDDPVARMMAWDALGYLPDDILVKIDRAAMAVGLETRAPFLDKRVAAVAWRLPMHMKIRAGSSKWALRQILYKYVPPELLERPKAGFAIPVGQWLRGPLRTWAEDLLHPDRIQSEGFLRPLPISQLWQQHLSGRYDHSAKLWTVLMWQSWHEQWG